MENYFAKMRGGKSAPPPRAALTSILFAWLGGFAAIALVGYLAKANDAPLVLGSFGASCVLLFGFPDSPFSQPRNVVGGHVLSTFIGLAFLWGVGPQWWSMALALATAIAAMQLTRTVHPPAGSNPLIVFLGAAHWPFLVTPTLAGAVLLVLAALTINNLNRERTYPAYWW